MILLHLLVDDVEVLFAPEAEMQERISRAIGAAKKEVVVAMYQFTSEKLADALVRARKRGVDVRVLVDGQQAADGGRFDDALQALEKGEVPVRRVFVDGNKKKTRSDNRPRFHHKFCVIDGELTIAGSYNWTVQGDEENHENALLISGRATARSYRDRFEAVWKDEKIAGP
jgi:phosphatidylserine/phosphatidylglycerophosphate/cardiolipin synthase-like enzyme